MLRKRDLRYLYCMVGLCQQAREDEDMPEDVLVMIEDSDGDTWWPVNGLYFMASNLREANKLFDILGNKGGVPRQYIIDMFGPVVVSKVIR